MPDRNEESKLHIEAKDLSDSFNARTSARQNAVETGLLRAHRGVLAEITPMIDTANKAINQGRLVLFIADPGAGDDTLVHPFHCASIAGLDFGDERKRPNGAPSVATLRDRNATMDGPRAEEECHLAELLLRHVENLKAFKVIDEPQGVVNGGIAAPGNLDVSEVRDSGRPKEPQLFPHPMYDVHPTRKVVGVGERHGACRGPTIGLLPERCGSILPEGGESPAAAAKSTLLAAYIKGNVGALAMRDWDTAPKGVLLSKEHLDRCRFVEIGDCVRQLDLPGNGIVDRVAKSRRGPIPHSSPNHCAPRRCRAGV